MARILMTIKNSVICFLLGVLVFFGISKLIFDNIYLTSEVVIDEEFHLPLGRAFCKRHFNVWDPKITTLPGLYLISALFLGPLDLCTTYWLRFTSLISSIINIFLFYFLLFKNEKSHWKNTLSSITLALLPPLYFFSHFYYTDVMGLTFVLLMMVFSESGLHYAASFCGFGSIICRQTNIVWVLLVAIKFVLIEIYKLIMPKHLVSKNKRIKGKFLAMFFKRTISNLFDIPTKMSPQFWLDILSYTSVIFSFLVFIIYNGSIVVGDINAHEATIHLPQLFYFSLFCLIFSWPHFLGEAFNFIKFARKNIALMFIFLIIGVIIVHFNTQVHPYLLADNRHYIFYIWNRFYAKYMFFRYIMVPVYIFAWYCIIKVLYDKEDVSFFIIYIPCVVAMLVPQKLIELRYFFIPYVLLRLRFKNSTLNVYKVVLEFVTYCVINAITLNIFFNKSVFWDDFYETQRIIW